jgi:hypothetical protein
MAGFSDMRAVSNWSSSAPDGERITPLWQPAQYVPTIAEAFALSAVLT